MARPVAEIATELALNGQSHVRALTICALLESCVWTCGAIHGLVAVMDDDDIVLAHQLCTRVGCLMEDNSVIALIWDDRLSIDARLAKLSAAANDIQALVAAARVLIPN